MTAISSRIACARVPPGPESTSPSEKTISEVKRFRVSDSRPLGSSPRPTCTRGIVSGEALLSVVPPWVVYAIVKPAARTAWTTWSLKSPYGYAKKYTGRPSSRLERLARAGRLRLKLRRRQQAQVDMVRRVIADVHPGAIELADLRCIQKAAARSCGR